MMIITARSFLQSFARILTGIVFVFSGFVKAIDPLGSTYKFTDYFQAFGLEFMSGLAFPLAILLSSAELIIGFSLLLGYRMKTAAWALLIFMSFFTVLTFILALTNPVHDCGCFGDAIILTNWQTFGKNIVLMVFVIIVFFERRKFTIIKGPGLEWTALFILFAGSVFLSVYCYNHLPLLDFRPYAKGVNIPSAMIIPEDAPQDVYETKLFYKNKATGKEEQFSIENIPDESAWEFVTSESKILSKGYQPPVRDFNIVAPDGQVITDVVLANAGYTFLLVSYNVSKADREGLSHAALYNTMSASSDIFDFYALTASVSSDIESVKNELNLGYDFHGVDEIVLKTMIRSNPGLILIKNGTVIGKWSHNDFPSSEDLLSDKKEYEQQLLTFLAGTEKSKTEEHRIYLFILGFLVFALMLRIFFERPL